jgi:formiminoglutamate deiminase
MATEPTRFWCEHAWLGEGPVVTGVVVEVADGRFGAVSAGVGSPPAGAGTLRGVTLPGLVNAHSHAFHRALRGRTEPSVGGPDASFWTWREVMYALAARLTPDRYHALATAVFGEMALAGITTVGEFHYLTDGGNEMGEAVIAAARAAGVRITLLDACYLRGGFDRPREGAQCRFGDASVDAWASRVDALARAHPDDEGVRIGAAVHSVRAVGVDDAAAVARFAAARDLPLHAHVSEQPAEVAECRRVHGTTPVALLAQAGVVGPLFCGVHAIHTTPEEHALLGTAGASVCLCPTTERDLGDGVAPAGALSAAGVRICLGTDSHAVVDPFEEARAVELDERLLTGRRSRHRPVDLLRSATSVGAAALGWDDVGRIAPGWRADLVTVSLGSVRMAGSPPGALDAAVVFAAAPADVVHVVVDGRTVVSDGRHRLLADVAASAGDAISAVWT